MQTVNWSGQGEGTLTVPFILEVDVGFDNQLPFNVLLTNNYIDAQNTVNYFKFSDSLTKYVLAFMISNRDSMLYYESNDAIKLTAFLTDKNDYLDGPFVVSSYAGIQYIAKQQIFDPGRTESAGIYTGLWVSNRTYNLNDTVMYEGFLYACIEYNSDEVFTPSRWENLSGIKTTIQTRKPLESDFDYELGNVWINQTDYSHYILVGNDNSIGIWNLSSTKADEVTLSLNNDEKLEIKDHTIEGGEW